jgi:hypothetical protein
MEITVRALRPAIRPAGPVSSLRLIELFGKIDGTQFLAAGKAGAFAKEGTLEEQHAEMVPTSHHI